MWEVFGRRRDFEPRMHHLLPHREGWRREVRISETADRDPVDVGVFVAFPEHIAAAIRTEMKSVGVTFIDLIFALDPNLSFWISAAGMGRRPRCDADTPYNDIHIPALAHLRRLREASHNGTAQFSPSSLPEALLSSDFRYSSAKPLRLAAHVGAQEAQVGADIDERRRQHGDATIEVVEFAHWLVMGSLPARRRGGLGRIGAGVPRPRGPAMT